MEEENKNKGLIAWCENHPKTIFVIRVILWATCAAILPFAFIAWRYDIFAPTSSTKLTGWGFIAIIILAIFVISLVRYIYKGLKPGLAKQCIFGFASIILPLLILYLLVDSLENSIALFKQALGCVILCEAVGIPLNPFPAWIAKRQVENEKIKAETMSDILWGKFFSRKKDEDK